MLKEFSMFGIILTSLFLVCGVHFDSGDVADAQFFENSDGNDTNKSNFSSNSTSSEDSDAADIVLLSQKLKKASLGYRDLIGQVKNVGNNSAESVSEYLKVYDKNGDVIGTENIYADIDTTRPGQKSTFKSFASR